jgi:predicted transcriptional regulator
LSFLFLGILSELETPTTSQVVITNMTIQARRFEPISTSELLIMKRIWKTDPTPQRLRVIADDLADTGLTYDTVSSLLIRLTKKGLLCSTMTTMGPKHKKFYYTYASRPGTCLESRLIDEIDDLAERLLDGDATELVVKLIEASHLDKGKIQSAIGVTPNSSSP